jgi:hypothetical protein
MLGGIARAPGGLILLLCRGPLTLPLTPLSVLSRQGGTGVKRSSGSLQERGEPFGLLLRGGPQSFRDRFGSPCGLIVHELS